MINNTTTYHKPAHSRLPRLGRLGSGSRYSANQTWPIIPLTLALLLAMSLFIPLAGIAQPQSTAPLQGKVALVTGSTDGLGREVAVRLGELGAHVIVHGRNEQRASEVTALINQGPGSAEYQLADLGRLDEVRALAERVLADHDQLHLLINNAGIGSGFAGGQRTLSDDGHEMIFQVNYLSHYLLTDMLLPAVRAAAPARIINVASGAQRPVDFDDPMMEEGFSGSAAYGQSKLAQILHSNHLAPQLIADDITINSLHPATMMDTTLVAQLDAPARTTVDEGATAVMNLATSPDLEGRTGLYFNGLMESQANAQAYDEAALRRLDALSRELTGL